MTARRWEQIARLQAGGRTRDYAEAYRRRFAAIAARGGDVHGEADFVEQLRPRPARVLDAGCGTGRVAARLHDRGYDVVGCDSDPLMIAAARRDRPTLDWRVCDLAEPVELADAEPFDVVALAGNVIPFLEDGTLAATALALARLTAQDGVLVAGFGLDAAHLPAGVPPVSLDDVDAAMHAAGLAVTRRWADWNASPFTDTGYVVATYRRG